MSKVTFEINLYDSDEGFGGNVEVVKLGQHTYQLMCNTFFSEDVYYGTVIEVEDELTDDGYFKLKSIIKASEYTQETYFLPIALNEAELRIVGGKIVEEGGYWEVVFGGMALVNLPKKSLLDVNEELNDLQKKKMIKRLLQGLINHNHTKAKK